MNLDVLAGRIKFGRFSSSALKMMGSAAEEINRKGWYCVFWK
jgi:hypothetical protein